MYSGEIIVKLLRAFPHSFVNPRGEFIAHARENSYFILEGCKSDMDIKCKVLEWLSRAAYKARPYKTAACNKKFNYFMRDGINKFLVTDFSHDDMAVIYQYLGNCVRHDLTIAFVESGYDMTILEGGRHNA